MLTTGMGSCSRPVLAVVGLEQIDAYRCRQTEANSLCYTDCVLGINHDVIVRTQIHRSNYHHVKVCKTLQF